jgi:nucleoid-associated protein Lsr2
VVEVEMATKVTVALEDHLDGGPAVETVRFSVGGAEYEIDLNKKNAAAFRRSWPRSSSTPVGPGGGRGAGPGARQ